MQICDLATLSIPQMFVNGINSHSQNVNSRNYTNNYKPTPIDLMKMIRVVGQTYYVYE